jgi:molybdate transport system ATP-binding protein
MSWAKAGYINLLKLSDPVPDGDLFSYRFGAGRLLMWAAAPEESVFELSSKDIMLFKGRPEAISARNLLRCQVTAVTDLENRVGVELDCGGERLVATVVRQAAEELGVQPGAEIYAVVKASAFRRLY